MNPTVTLNPFPSGKSGAENRREARRPGRGNVVVRWSNPGSQEVEGRLLDISDRGFRMIHACTALTAGQYVEFSHFEAKGRARVVWTRINAGKVESGFVVAS